MDSIEKIVLLLVSGQGIVLSLALISSVFKRKYASFLLGLITLVITLEVLNIWAMRVSYHSLTNAFPFWLFGSYLIIPPTLLLFIKVNTQPTFQLKFKHFIIFLPALIEIVVELFSFYSNRFLNTNYQLIENAFWFTYTEIVPVLMMIPVLFLFAKELKSLSKRLKKLQNTKPKHHRIYRLYFFFITFLLLTIFWCLLTIFNFQVFIIIETVLLLFIFILGYMGYFQPSFFDIPKDIKRHIIKEKFPQFNDDKELKRLKSLFEEQKIYTKQKLTLKEVASQLELPERYVSGLINSYHKTNFTAYVNSFRVFEALERINNPKNKNKTLLGIAMESGFNSKSSFNSVFKSYTGKNPSDYLKN